MSFDIFMGGGGSIICELVHSISSFSLFESEVHYVEIWVKINTSAPENMQFLKRIEKCLLECYVK